MNKEKEQKLKDEYDNAVRRAQAILMAVGREGDARWLEKVALDTIGCNWITEKEKVDDSV